MKQQKYHYESNYFPFYDKTYPKVVVVFFIMECAVITILNMILSTILLLYDFVGICWLWLTSIPTVKKDLNKINETILSGVNDAEASCYYRHLHFSKTIR